MGDNRPPVYWEEDEEGNRYLIIRASAIGHPCLWELIAAGQDEMMLPVPNVLQRAFNEGNELEPVIVKRLENQYDVRFDSHQSEGELWLGDYKAAIRYHSDGIGQYKSDWWVVEIKALSNSLWQIAARIGGSVGDVISEYPWQLSSMMHGEGLPGLWVAYNKGMPPDENGVRPDCDDAGKILIEKVDTPPITLTEIQLKASLILEGVNGEPILSSDRRCDTPDHWPCRYLHIRPEEDGSLGVARKVFIPDDPTEIDRLAVEFLSFKGQMDEAKARYEAARNRLVELAGDAAFIQTDKFYIPVVGGTSVTTNSSAMSQELKDVIAKYKVKKVYKYVKGIKRLGF